MNKKTENNQKKSGKLSASFKSRNFKGGIFAFAACLAMLAFVIILNLVVSKINLTADLTSNSLYSISEKTREFAQGITDTVRIYYFAETGTENEQIRKIVEKYDGLGKDMKLVYVDPVLHPTFAFGLVGNAEATDISSDSVIVVNETKNRHKVILSSEMITAEYSFNYSTYSYDTTYSVNVENMMDSALQYVTTENLPKVYVTASHGEVALNSAITALLSNNNMESETLELMTASEVPLDCDVLLMNYPAYDITDAELEVVKSYLAKGGKAILNLSYINTEHTNLMALLAYYGLDLNPGIVIEGDTKYYTSGYPMYLLPAIETADATKGVRGVRRVIAPFSSGLTEREDKRGSVDITALFTTSDSAFSKVDTESGTTAKAENDIDGPFMTAAYVSEDSIEGTTEIYVYSSLLIFDEQLLSNSSYGNADIFLNSINGLAGNRDSFTVAAKSLESAYILMSDAQIDLHRNIKMVALPLICIIAGTVIFIIRRRQD